MIASCFGGAQLDLPPNPDDKRDGFARAIAAMEADVAREYQCGYVPDMQRGIKPNGDPAWWTDNNHPNSQGNRIVAEELLDALTKALQRARQ